MRLLNLDAVEYTNMSKLWSIALGNLFTIQREKRKIVLKVVICCRSPGEEKINSDSVGLELTLSGSGRVSGILPGETTLDKWILSIEN